MGRATQGVRLIKINEGDSIAAVAKVEVEVEEEDMSIEEAVNGADINTVEPISGQDDGISPEN
jgi:DNA gyrase subunit A